jgi:signal transduction histidine kinase
VVDDALNVAGRTWTIRWMSRREGFGPALILAGSTFVGGMIITALLFSLLRVQLRARAEAELTAERLRESEAALQKANRAKDEFLATLSHELRTPMTSIMGWAQMMADEDLDEETEKSAVEAILRSGTLQAQLIDDLLDLSRITAGKMRIELSPVELAPLVLAAIDTVRPASQAKGVRVEWDLAPNVWVNGDPQRLQQVTWNLLSNAVKFTESGGMVRVATFADHSDAVVEVTDTGQGIEPEFMPFLFERFRQADSSSTRKHTGLGLGLAIVRHLIELHGGTISADSKGTGRGATFHVRLPLMR